MISVNAPSNLIYHTISECIIACQNNRGTTQRIADTVFGFGSSERKSYEWLALMESDGYVKKVYGVRKDVQWESIRPAREPTKNKHETLRVLI